MRYEVTYTAPGSDGPTTTVTDARGVTELLQRLSATGTRAHVRPLPDTDPATSD